MFLGQNKEQSNYQKTSNIKYHKKVNLSHLGSKKYYDTSNGEDYLEEYVSVF